MTLLVRNATLRNTEGLTDILIADGKYATVAPNINGEADSTIDAGGSLVSPTFVDPHLHIDKVYTALPGQGRREQTREETLEESIKLMHDIKRAYTVDDVEQRAVRAIRESVMRGATKIRANADIDTIGGLTALRGCLAAHG